VNGLNAMLGKMYFHVLILGNERKIVHVVNDTRIDPVAGIQNGRVFTDLNWVLAESNATLGKCDRGSRRRTA
jgi:hypothetical protein